MIAGKVILNAISFGIYYLTPEGRAGGLWVRKCDRGDCGYEGKLNDFGSEGFHCPRCGVKLLCQNNPFV